MKRMWVSLLAALFVISFIMTGAMAETNGGIEVVIDPDGLDVSLESEDGIILENIGGLLDDTELPEIDEINGITLDSLEGTVEPETTLAVSAVANDGSSSDFEIVNGVLVKYNGAGGDVTIPDGVIMIDSRAFYGSRITSVAIPNTVTSIGYEAFADSSLESITIPDSVTNIGGSLFFRCSHLSNVTLGKGIQSIPTTMFYSCSGLTSIIIPNSVKSINDWAFEFCSDLREVTIPNTVTNIGWLAFSGCTNLANITIPDGVINIDEGAFSGCSSLTTIIIPNSVISIGSFAFSNCSSLSSVVIPDSIISLGETTKMGGGGGTFSGCSNLTNVSIGSGVTTIGPSTFYNCMRLESIALSDRITAVKDKAFGKCYSLTNVTILNGEINIEDSSFDGCMTTATFYTPCESKATKWAESHGYNVIKSEHILEITPAVAPTCTQTGLTEGSHCSVCGEILVPQQVIPKLISVKACKITGIKDAVYTGKAIVPVPVVEYNGNKLVRDTDYTIQYSNNKAVGTATVTITGIGKYGETVNKTFKINPRPVKLSAVTPGTKQLTVTWKKGKGITGYEVQYSLKKTFASAKKVTIPKAATVKTVLKQLQPKKTYYVRIRTYKTVKGRKYYSTWSSAKVITTKG